LAGKSTKLKPTIKKKVEKAPARKAAKTKVAAKTISKSKKQTPKSAAVRQKAPVKSTKSIKPQKPKSQAAKKAVKKVISKAAVSKATSKPKTVAKPAKKVKAAVKKSALVKAKTKKMTPSKASPKRPVKTKTMTKVAKPSNAATQIRMVKPFAPKVILPPPKKHLPPPAPKQPTPNEAVALKAFEKAHKEFVRGRFTEARDQFRELLEKHSAVVEVAARARTYLAIAESRIKADTSLPKDADSLYDRGVIELNRGEFAIAQDFFERALKREPEAAHIHYGLAATKAQLGATEEALKSLEQAFSLRPILRSRATQDMDLAPLHSTPEFEQLVSP
jgi:tetratricopeptide (TPR) repeat protein